ncbi:MAG: hypothetical protein HY678_08950 [Chloroflexi bacterium]|nr:hypothetical protein [Chloroflexota bacterium]
MTADHGRDTSSTLKKLQEEARNVDRRLRPYFDAFESGELEPREFASRVRELRVPSRTDSIYTLIVGNDPRQLSFGFALGPGS